MIYLLNKLSLSIKPKLLLQESVNMKCNQAYQWTGGAQK